MVADPLGLGLRDRVRGRIEGQASNDDLRQRIPGHIDTGPKTVGAKQHGVAQAAHLIGQLGAREVGALHEKRPRCRAELGLQRAGDGAHIGVTREQNQRAARHGGDAETDVVGERIEREFGLLRRGQRYIGSDVDAHVARIIERRVHDLGPGGLGSDARGEGGDVAPNGERGARADDAHAAAEEVLAECRRDVDRRAAQADDGLLPSAPLGPVNVTLGGEREPLGKTGLEAFDARFLLEQFVARAAVVEFIGELGQQPFKRAERAVERRLGHAGLAHPYDRALGEKRRRDEIEKLL